MTVIDKTILIVYKAQVKYKYIKQRNKQLSRITTLIFIQVQLNASKIKTEQTAENLKYSIKNQTRLSNRTKQWIYVKPNQTTMPRRCRCIKKRIINQMCLNIPNYFPLLKIHVIQLGDSRMRPVRWRTIGIRSRRWRSKRVSMSRDRYEGGVRLRVELQRRNYIIVSAL